MRRASPAWPPGLSRTSAALLFGQSVPIPSATAVATPQRAQSSLCHCKAPPAPYAQSALCLHMHSPACVHTNASDAQSLAAQPCDSVRTPAHVGEAHPPQPTSPQPQPPHPSTGPPAWGLPAVLTRPPQFRSRCPSRTPTHHRLGPVRAHDAHPHAAAAMDPMLTRWTARLRPESPSDRPSDRPSDCPSESPSDRPSDFEPPPVVE